MQTAKICAPGPNDTGCPPSLLLCEKWVGAGARILLFPHGEPPPLLSPLSLSVYFHQHRNGSEDSPLMFGKTVYGSTFKDVPFVPLQSATFCVQCELISTSNKPFCLACGSNTLLGLSRVLGGTLRNQ